MPYISKVDTAQKIYAEELRKIGESAENWKDFLDFSAKSNLTDNQEMPEFSSKVVIHAYNPNAVDCRTFDDWKKQEGNHVNFREKGIPVLTRDNSGKVRVAHVFDTSQTAKKILPERPELPETTKGKIKAVLQSEIQKYANNPRFSDEQKRLFQQTAEYKLSKQFGLKTDENSERFSGIEKLSVNEMAFIGIALNGCSRSFAQIVNHERSFSNERNNINKSADDRKELYGREPRGMDMGGGVPGTRQEVRIRRGQESMVQTQRSERDIRTPDRNSAANAYSGNGQVRKHETEIHMADPMPNGRNTVEWKNRRGEALRRNERESLEPDRRDSGEKETVSGIQGNRGVGEISSEVADVGTVQSGSGRRDSSRDGIRNITGERAEPNKVSALSDLSEKPNEPNANINTEYSYNTADTLKEYEDNNRKENAMTKEDFTSFLVESALNSDKVKNNIDIIISLYNGEAVHNEVAAAVLKNEPNISIENESIHTEFQGESYEISCEDFAYALRKEISENWDYSDIITERLNEKNINESPDIQNYFKDNNLFDNSTPEIPAEREKATVQELNAGDVILYEGLPRRVEKIDNEEIHLKSLINEDTDVGDIEVFAFEDWQELMNENGIEIVSRAVPEATLDVDKSIAEASIPKYTQLEQQFLDGDIAGFMAKDVLAWDEIEDLGYRLYEKGYIDKFSPNENAIYGYGLRETELYDMAKRMQSGEDIRRELSEALLGGLTSFTTKQGNQFDVEYGNEYITARYENAEKQISYEEMGNAFFKLIEGEYNDIVNERTAEDLQKPEQEISEETKPANPISNNKDTKNETTVEESQILADEIISDIPDNAIDNTSIENKGHSSENQQSIKSVDDLQVGDIVKFEGETWKISKIDGDFSIGLENTDKSALNSVRSIIGNWKDNFENSGFEYVQQEGNDKTEIPDKIAFEVLGGGSVYFRDEQMNDLAEINADGIRYYTELSESDRKKVTEKAKELTETEKNIDVDKAGLESSAEGKQLSFFNDSVKPASEVTPEQTSEKDNQILTEQSGQSVINQERTSEIQSEEKNMPKISDMEAPIRDNLLTALHDNRKDIPSGISMDFNGNGHQLTYADRAIMLEAELKNNNISVPEAINVMRLIGFNFEKDKITFERPDTSKIHNAFNKFIENHSELSEYTRKFLERAEIVMANRLIDNFQDVVSSSVMTFSYGQPEKINENVFGGKLDEVTKEINGYINGLEQSEQQAVHNSVNTERVTVTHSENMSSHTEESKKKSDYFRITDEHLGEGSKREKFQNNVDAIKMLKRLENEERAATPEEQETLSKYVGWGGLQEAFDRNDTSWNKEYIELKKLLSEEEYEAAMSTVNDAFYTSPVITNAIYEGLANIGFKGGEILEPSCGVGNFLGTMPDKIRENSNLSGVEIDSISGRIAQKLYPEANIAINGFEKVKPSKGAFDLAVGNVPFGNHGVADNTKAYKGLLIHDYFFAKSLDSVRSGGVVAFVTSTGTLDKEDTKVRQMLAQKAELMGAVRLPNNAFQKNAGTQTSTDIIFLKKREKPLNISEMQTDKSCDWVHTKTNADGYKINSYFADNPEMVLGNLSDKGVFGSIICTPIPGADLKEQLHEAMNNIKGEYVPLEFQNELDERSADKYLKATPDIENLTYTVVENKLYFRVDDNLIPLKESEQHGVIAERRKAMCGLGETTRELLKAQVEDRPDIEIKSLQAELNTKYDSFVKKFGRINPIEAQSKTNASGVSRKSANSNAFKNDVRLPLLQSLEKMKEGQFIRKAEIFTERTIRPRQVAEHVETAQEALILSMSEKGKIDLDYMKQLTGFEENKLINDLHGDIFPVPELSSESKTVYQPANEYLSGNIYKKIAAAEEKIAENPEYAENISALKQVIPPPLKATEIDMQLGMTWIDPKIIQQFMYETFDTKYPLREYTKENMGKNPNAITVNFSGSGKGTWYIENARRDNSIKATKNFGTKDYNAYELLEKILNSKSVAVTQTSKDSEGRTKTVILEKETKAAEDKVKLINSEFKKWIFADPERRNELVKTYNEKFNCIRPREYDGSHLNFFGSNPEITLKPHQKNAVAHALFGGNTLFAHQVGAGKTFEMIATAMEGKRLGLHNKSMFVVPNHLTEQIGSDFMKLYPNANILVAKPDDFSPQKRRQMCARIATGNFDAVIIGHSQLIKIPLSPKREETFIKNQINEVVASLEAAKETDSKSYTVKQLEATKKNLRDRLEKLTNSTVKDNTVTFEELGIDKLFVDEAHEFKNLYVSTKMENVSGLSTNADVQKTQDLYLKCQYLDEKTNSKGVVFSTGTPVTNALSEMYTMQKYLQSDMLRDMGIDSFDSWAGNFTRKSTETEISPSGSDWRMKTRLKFTNVPELVTMFKECADIKMADQLNLNVPECSKNIVSVEPTELQKRVVQSLGERADKISKGEVSRTEDNMLLVTGDGRKLGLDQRMFDLSFPDEPQSKVNACVKNVHDIWASTMENKSTQIIFCDLGVPQSKEDLKKNGERFDVYNDIKSKLIEKGIPEKEIAFIHDANSETEKAKLFAKVRSGDVRVLIGSTQKMGAGTNVQDKLIALHDLDCPWRPADLTQRLGRMVRQGNENDRVHNFRYVTKGTFDAYLYQMVEKKQESISQIFTSKAIARTCDDIDDMAVDFMQVKMAAVGDDRIRRQMELREDIRSLNMLKNSYLENRYELQDNIRELPNKIEKAEKLVEDIVKDTKMIEAYVPPRDIDGKEIMEMKIGGQTFTDKKEAGEAFNSAMTQAIAKNPQKPTEIAEYKGFKIAVSYDPFTRIHHGTLKGAANYPFELGSSESGNLTRINNVISSISKRTDIVCNDIERMKNELAESMQELNKPFSHESELTEKQQELEQLTAEIDADKLKGKIAPEQPENTAESKNIATEKPSEKSEDTPEKTDNIPTEKAEEKAPENNGEPDNKDVQENNALSENTEEQENNTPSANSELQEKNDSSEKAEASAAEPTKEVPEEKTETLNIKWIQNGKKIQISFDSSAENPITAFAAGKEVGKCKPDEFVVTKIPDNEKKNYPIGITHYVKPLNIAFGSSVAEHIIKFANKVKEICSKIKGRDKFLFSRDKIMSDKFKPTSSKNKNEQAQNNQQEIQ